MKKSLGAKSFAGNCIKRYKDKSVYQVGIKGGYHVYQIGPEENERLPLFHNEIDGDEANHYDDNGCALQSKDDSELDNVIDVDEKITMKIEEDQDIEDEFDKMFGDLDSIDYECDDEEGVRTQSETEIDEAEKIQVIKDLKIENGGFKLVKSKDGKIVLKKEIGFSKFNDLL